MKKLLLALAILMLPAAASAHPGGRDAYGGHYDWDSGEYHVHEGPLAGRKYKSQENMLKVLQQTKGGPAIIKRAEQGQAQKPAQHKSGKDESALDVLREIVKDGKK